LVFGWPSSCDKNLTEFLYARCQLRVLRFRLGLPGGEVFLLISLVLLLAKPDGFARRALLLANAPPFRRLGLTLDAC
jgi:hypothetical protein